MSNIGVGKEIVTYCSKCKLDLGHIIVVMKDAATPHKVQCNTCKSTHSFKAPKTVTKRRASSGTRKPRQTKEEKIINLWEEGIENFSGEPIKYSIKTKFEEGQVINHPKFGPGVVDKIIDTNKIEVIFRTDVKILMHAKS